MPGRASTLRFVSPRNRRSNSWSEWDCEVGFSPLEDTFIAMRPIIPKLSNPSGTTVTRTDGIAVGATPATLGDPRNEIGFRIERGLGLTGSYVTIGTTLANVSTWTDSTTRTAGTTYRYRVVAFNASGNSPSAPVTITRETDALTGKLIATVGGVADSAVAGAGAKATVYTAAGVNVKSSSLTGGSYTLVRPPGTYKLYIEPNKSGYPNQWWGGTSLATAKIITVAATNITESLTVHISTPHRPRSVDRRWWPRGPADLRLTVNSRGLFISPLPIRRASATPTDS